MALIVYYQVIRNIFKPFVLIKVGIGRYCNSIPVIVGVFKLPPKCKETFLLSKQEGLTNIEIANFMNVSIRTVESHMNKAFRILREKLKDKVKPILFLMFGLDLKNGTPDSAF